MLLGGFLGVCADLSSGADATNRITEIAVLLKSGEGRLMSYGLYYLATSSRAASNAPPGADLILILRNTGAKFINLEHVTVREFVLRDAHGKDMKLYLRSRPIGMPFGHTEVVHLWVDHPKNAVEPWSLKFETFSAGMSGPLFLEISGIEPSKAVRK